MGDFFEFFNTGLSNNVTTSVLAGEDESLVTNDCKQKIWDTSFHGNSVNKPDNITLPEFRVSIKSVFGKMMIGSLCDWIEYAAISEA